MSEDKTLNELYRQRAQAFQLAAVFARKLGNPVGIRYDDNDEKKEWPVLSIELTTGQVALHVWHEDLHSVWLDPLVPALPFDAHTNEQKEERILEMIKYFA